MAMPLGALSGFLLAETAPIGNLSTSPNVAVVPATLRVLRPLKVYAASKPATEIKSRAPRGIMKPKRVSPELQAFLGGVPEIPRTQALKEIIKRHNLQV